MWYVIQTVTGQEEELVTLIRAILDKELFTDCFVLKAEWMKRLGGRWHNQVRPLFPGYIFIDTMRPDEVFMELKHVPRFSKILGSGACDFTPLNEEEREFLSLLSSPYREQRNGERIVRLTKVITDRAGAIISLNGILQEFREQIVNVNLHKRYAVIEITLFQKRRTLIFGIKLKQDR